jgi:hypothetical protein
MAHRYEIAEFADLIRREGGMWNLFGDVGITPEQAPPGMAVLVEATNRGVEYLNFMFGEIAKACGYREDDA